MGAVAYDIEDVEPRNRLTNAFRPILAIPHLIVAYAWRVLAQLLAVVQWFVVVFTGRRNDAVWTMQRSYLGYSARVMGYATLMYDRYPAFGPEPGAEPVRFELQRDDPPNRLTTGLRLIWAIPALVITALLGIAFGVVVVISWFAILFTGRHPQGMFAFKQKALRYFSRTESYVLLGTDTYPTYD